MQKFNGSTFDARGFVFALKSGLFLLVLLTSVHVGTAYASDFIFKKSSEAASILDRTLIAAAEKRKTQSEGQMQLLRELNAFEESLATHSIGTASIESLSQSHTRMIGADLTAMKLYIYENGYAIKTFTILSKGKRGSQWETPTGLYNVATKEVDHFSSIGEVHMPYSMQFFGNFFIHGWPSYPDGTPVPEGYSGGCIRLSTEDAQEVFEFAQIGTPLFAWNGPSLGAPANSSPISIKAAPPSTISAASFVVADITTGKVYAQKDAETPRPIASLSKLMTALVANETIHFGRTLTVTSDDRIQTEGTPGSIPTDDTFTIGDLLYPLLMESNNSVAYTLARYYGSENFLSWMNAKARAIGMEHTFFDDPSGISEKNVASASDLFRFIRYIQDSQSYILNITRLPKKTITSERGRDYTLNNFNVFYKNPQFLGGKTGYTDPAKETMMTIFELPIDSATATVAIVVLGSSDRKKDVEALLSWFRRNATVESAHGAPTVSQTL